MSKFAKFTLIKFVLPTDTSSEEFCTAYYFLHGSLEGKFSVVKSCNTILVSFQTVYEQDYQIFHYENHLGLLFCPPTTHFTLDRI